MSETMYIETSILGYLTARSTKNLILAANAVQGLAAQFLTRSSLPPKAKVDAVHIAAATVHGMDYLLTWNCKHIANAQLQGKLAEISLDFGYVLPIFCTPNDFVNFANKVKCY